MTPVFIDYETFWSVDYSLSKMSPITYVMHPKTEIQSVAVKVGFKGATQVYFGEDDIRAAWAEIDWDDAWVIAHNNSEFDALIHAWRFGIRPKLWGCTLALARAPYAKVCGLSLDALLRHLGAPMEKGSLEVVNTKGKYLADFTEHEKEKMRVYNAIDTEGCAWLFRHLAKLTPPEEFEILDMTIRMLVEPEFVADVPLLETALIEERRRKSQTLMDIATLSGAYKPGMDEDEAQEAARKTLASGAKFAAYLRDLGVDPPMKKSPRTGKMTPALAKTDPAFMMLQAHPDPLVSAAAQARLGVKSTHLESRLENLLEAAEYSEGLLPMPLKYYGADTTGRWSGFIYNPQNFTRISRNKDGSVVEKLSNAMRFSLKAPPGKKVVVADLSGIELRVNMFLWQVPYAMELFNADPEKADLYKYFAAHELYGIPEEDVTKDQRQVGKVSHLGLGFGAGAETFQLVALTQGGVKLPLDFDPSKPDIVPARDIVLKYRKLHKEIVRGWRTCQNALPSIAAGEKKDIDPWGLCYTTAEGIKTPRGMIRYPNLRQVEVIEDGEPTGNYDWVYGKKNAKIYAGKIDENIVQHLAKCAMSDMMLQVKRMTGLPAKLTVHDELVYLVDEDKAEAHLDTVQGVMREGVSWWPELVTWSEGSIGDSYGDAK
jgi:hypothetical protein